MEDDKNTWEECKREQHYEEETRERMVDEERQ